MKHQLMIYKAADKLKNSTIEFFFNFRVLRKNIFVLEKEIACLNKNLIRVRRQVTYLSMGGREL